jgi:hypothetical protein
LFFTRYKVSPPFWVSPSFSGGGGYILRWRHRIEQTRIPPPFSANFEHKIVCGGGSEDVSSEIK